MFAPVLLHVVVFDPCLKRTHAAKTVTQTHIREKDGALCHHQAHTHTHTHGHTECENSTQPDLELTRWDDVNRGLVGMLGD